MRYIRIIGHVERTTDAALLMKAGRDDKLWIPRAVVKTGEVAEAGDAEIEVSEDWLILKGMEWWAV
jgi:hypothetical protein